MNIHPQKRVIANIAYLHQELQDIVHLSKLLREKMDGITLDLKNQASNYIDEHTFSRLSSLNQGYLETLDCAKQVHLCIEELNDVLKDAPLSDVEVTMNDHPAIISPVEVMVLQSINDNLYSTDDINELREFAAISQQTVNNILEKGIDRAVSLASL